MSRWDEVTTYADYQALCRDTNQDEDEATVPPQVLRYLRPEPVAVPDPPTLALLTFPEPSVPVVRLHTHRPRHWHPCDDLTALVLVCVPVVELMWAGFNIGCWLLGGDPTL